MRNLLSFFPLLLVACSSTPGQPSLGSGGTSGQSSLGGSGGTQITSSPGGAGGQVTMPQGGAMADAGAALVPGDILLPRPAPNIYLQGRSDSRTSIIRLSGSGDSSECTVILPGREEEALPSQPPRCSGSMTTFNRIYTKWAPSMVTMPECINGVCTVTVAPEGPTTPYLWFEIWPETYDTVAVEVEIEGTIVLSESVTADLSEGPFVATID